MALVFTAMTGARVATVRALLMALAVLAGLAVRRPIASSSALGAAILVAVAAEPSLVTDAGFQFSVSATAILIASVGRRRAGGVFARVRGAALLALRASLATALITAPIASAHFGRVAPAGVLANLLVVPMIELGVLPLGIAGTILSFVHRDLGSGMLDLAASLAEHTADIARWFAEAIGPTLGPSGLGAGLACWLAAVAVARFPRRACWVSALAGALVVATLAVWPDADSPFGELAVTFVDVGQGDAAVIEWPNKEVWLVDVGPSDERPGRLLAVLDKLSVQDPSRVILTHGHPDHDGALDQITDRFPDIEVVRARGRGGAHTRSVPPRLGRQDVGGAWVWFLAPIYVGPDATEDPVLGDNDNSIIMLVEYRGRRVLLAGDAEEEAEQRLLAGYPMLGRIDVIKVPHHGSETSSSLALIERTRPSVAVISCGAANSFGHPAASIEARYREAGARILRTDVHGSVHVVVEAAGTMLVRTSRNRR